MINMKYYEKHWTPYQIKKFKTVFRNQVDVDGNGVWEEADVDALVEKMRKHARVERGDQFYEIFAKHGKDAFQYMREDIRKNIDKYGLPDSSPDHPIDLDVFLCINCQFTVGKTKMEELPNYIKDLPKVYHTVIDSNDDQNISKNELRRFFVDFQHVSEDKVDEIVEQAYNEWTENGKYKLDLERYTKIFEDFMFAREPVGPGRLLFGHPSG